MATNYISQVEIGGVLYNVKDAELRTLVEQLGQSDIAYRGVVTSPALYDGFESTGLVTINNAEVQLTNGDVVIYKTGTKDLEFIYLQDPGVFNEFGSSGALKALAFADTANGSGKTESGGSGTVTVSGSTSGVAVSAHSYTPAGSVSVTNNGTTVESEFTGTEGTVSVSGNATDTVVGAHSYTPAGTINTPSFTGTKSSHNHSISAVANANGNYTPAGTITAPTFTGTAMGNHKHTVSVAANSSGNYTPAGTISAPTFTGTEVTPSVTNNKVTATSVTPTMSASFTGTAGSHAHGGSTTAMVASVNGEKLVFSTGSVTINNQSVTPSGTVSVSGGAHTHDVTTNVTVAKFTPAGTVAAPTFSGTKVLISTSDASAGTPAGTITAPTFTGTKVLLSTANADLTPAGTIGALTFSGAAATLSHSAHDHAVTASGKFTPSGTVDSSLELKLSASFSGTAASLTHTVTQGSVSASGNIAAHTHDFDVTVNAD